MHVSKAPGKCFVTLSNKSKSPVVLETVLVFLHIDERVILYFNEVGLPVTLKIK